MIFDDPTRTIVLHMDDQKKYYSGAIDSFDQTIVFSIGRDSLKKDYPFS